MGEVWLESGAVVRIDGADDGALRVTITLVRLCMGALLLRWVQDGIGGSPEKALKAVGPAVSLSLLSERAETLLRCAPCSWRTM
jgi:hypothetical protein